MKKLLLIAAVVFAFTACVNEDTGWENKTEVAENVGYLYFGEGGLQVAVDEEVGAGDVEPGSSTRASRTRATVDAEGTYTIQIFDKDGNKVEDFTYANLSSKYTTDEIEGTQVTGIKLPVGEYTVKAFSAETPNYSPTPQYAGITTVTLTKGTVTNIALTCKLSSVKVTVTFDPIMADVIDPEATSVLVRLDEEAIEEEANRSQYTYTGYDDKSELTASHDVVTPIYLKPQSASAEGAPLNLYLSTLYGKQVDDLGEVLQAGTQISLQKLFVANAKAGEWRKVTIKLDHGTEGTVYFVVEVETWVYNEVIDVTQTMYALNGVLMEGEIPDVTDAPVIETPEGGLDLTQNITLLEDMFDASTGAYTGNASMTAITKQPIKKIYLSATSDNTSLSSSITEMGLVATAESHGLDLTAVTGTTEIVLNSWGFPVGTTIAGVNELPFSLAGLMTSLQKSYQGNHTFSLTIVDEKNNTSTTTLSITSGVAPNTDIIWQGMDISQRYDIYTGAGDDTKMILVVTAKSGIKELWVTIEGELAPLLVDVGLPETFNLVEPGTNAEGEDLGEILSGLGFLVRDKVVNKNSILFDITSFKPLLEVAPGYTDFKVRLVENDETQNPIEASMMINVIKGDKPAEN